MKAFFYILIFLLFCFIILNLLVSQYEEESNMITDSFICQEYSQRDTISNTSIHHQRSWKDSKYFEEYCTYYTVKDQHYSDAYEFRNKFTPHYDTYKTSNGYWGNIYHHLVKSESNRLYNLQDSLNEIGIKNTLNTVDFADMIVSFVQDIPYSFVMSKSCEEITDGTPCIDAQKFGLLSPTEFLYTLKGDCDTRTTLLYKLLKHFGYEVMVVISDEYAHAMLAINLPVSGDYITYKGKKFHFWETTNIGWKPGMLSAEMKNINYWKIALSYE